MDQQTSYSLCFKLISVSFKTKSLLKHLLAKVECNNQQKVKEELIFDQYGNLYNTVNLEMQIDQKQFEGDQQIQLIVCKGNLNGCLELGRLRVEREMFDSFKLQKLKLKNCFDDEAFIETYLIKTTSRISTTETLEVFIEEENQNKSFVSQQTQKINSKKSSFQKIIKPQEETENYTPLNEEQPSTVTFARRSESLQFTEIDVESLVTVNGILEQKVENLQAENTQLLQKINQLTFQLEQINKPKSSRSQKLDFNLLENFIEKLKEQQKEIDNFELYKEKFQIVNKQNQDLEKQVKQLRKKLKEQKPTKTLNFCSSEQNLVNKISKVIEDSQKKEVKKKVHFIDSPSNNNTSQTDFEQNLVYFRSEQFDQPLRIIPNQKDTFLKRYQTPRWDQVEFMDI